MIFAILCSATLVAASLGTLPGTLTLVILTFAWGLRMSIKE